MLQRFCGKTFIIFMLCMALPAWGEQYMLYTPQPATSGQEAASHDGILVKEIEIQKGDTLYDISRKFSGRGTYYPQILLFNSIKNPDLIRTGKSLKVPVSKREADVSDQSESKPATATRKHLNRRVKNNSLAAPTPPVAHHVSESAAASPATTELSLRDLKTAGSEKRRTNHNGKKTILHPKKNRTQATPAVKISAQPTAPLAAAGQQLFEAAATAYRRDDCRSAIELLDRFLSANAGSPLAADANLYKADCYLKLSAQ